MMTDGRAFELLAEYLGHKGKLKIITAFPNPERDLLCTPVRPSYFIQHDVVRIEARGEKAKAFSEEGDTCSGRPEALLARLTEWARETNLNAVGL